MESWVSATSFRSGVCDVLKVLDTQWDVVMEQLKLLHSIFIGVWDSHTQKKFWGKKLLGNMLSSWLYL